MAAFDDDVKFDHSIKSVSIAPMLISVFLVLLTIFVVLNTVSRVDKPKFNKVVRSVSQAFDIVPPIQYRETEQGGSGEAVLQFFSDVEGWAQSIVFIKGMRPTRVGNTILVRIPATEMFENDRAEFVAGGEYRMRMLGRLLSGWTKAFRVTSEIVLEMRIFDTQEDAIFETLSIRRAGMIAETLAAEQVKEDTLAPGIRKTLQADADYIYLRFTLSAPKAILPAAPSVPSTLKGTKHVR